MYCCLYRCWWACRFTHTCTHEYMNQESCFEETGAVTFDKLRKWPRSVASNTTPTTTGDFQTADKSLDLVWGYTEDEESRTEPISWFLFDVIMI